MIITIALVPLWIPMVIMLLIACMIAWAAHIGNGNDDDFE